MSVGTAVRRVLVLQKTFAATTTSTKLLRVDWRATVPGGTLSVLGDGTPLPLMAEQASPTSGFTRSYFLVLASSLAVTRFTWTSPPVFSTGQSFYIDQVTVTNVPPSTGTLRQQMRSLEVKGSARAPGTLTIESSTAALGNGVLAYVFPPAGTNGYTPALRQYRTSGTTVTADAAMVSGSREGATGAGITFTIPNSLLPTGGYQLLVRMALSTAGTETGNIVVTASSTIPASSGTAYTRSVTLTDAWKTQALMRLVLPPTAVSSQSVGATIINIDSSGWSLTPLLDEAWLFNTTIGQLVHVDCGTGAGSVGGSGRRLFINPPSIETPRPTILMGHSADGSDAFYPSGTGYGVRGWQQPVFPPPQVNLFFVTPGATDAVASLSGFPHWHTHAAE